MYKISVQGSKYVVVNVRGKTETPARNWKQLADNAKRAVLAQSGSTMHNGLYDCPDELAQQAR